jgi:hypothetical protein
MPNDAARVTKLILLIDGENLDARHASVILDKASELGTIAEGRIYGAADNGRMKGWIKSADARHLRKVYVTRISARKDTADFKLTIEAMDMLHTRAVDGFCIASSDGDFTALAERIRASALSIYAFGEKKAPALYQQACDMFFDCAALAAEKKTASRQAAPLVSKAATSATARRTPKAAPPKTAANKATPAPAAKPAPATGAKPGQRPRGVPAEIAQRIVAIVDGMEAANKPTDMRSMGNALPREIPEFQVGKYGYGDTKGLLKDVPGLEIVKDGGNSRVRRKAPAGG